MRARVLFIPSKTQDAQGLQDAIERKFFKRSNKLVVKICILKISFIVNQLFLHSTWPSRHGSIDDRELDREFDGPEFDSPREPISS